MSIIACSVDGCDKLTGMKGTARGLCSKHYNRWLRNGDPLVRTQRNVTDTCTLPGCGKPHDAKGLCTAHITNLRRHGTPSPRKRGEVVNGMKVCAECLVEQPTTNFYPIRQSWNARCKPCVAVVRKAYRDAHADHVRAQARKSAAKRPHQRRDAARKRRATLRSAAVENVASIDVYDRDGWICGICAAPIPRVTMWPHPLSPSLDHVVALSVGGAHSYSNTQASHLACNMSKGARAA